VIDQDTVDAQQKHATEEAHERTYCRYHHTGTTTARPTITSALLAIPPIKYHMILLIRCNRTAKRALLLLLMMIILLYYYC